MTFESYRSIGRKYPRRIPNPKGHQERRSKLTLVVSGGEVCDGKVAGNVMYFYFKTTKERKRGSFSLCRSLDLLKVFVYLSSSPVF
jgi:hypothetical protein